MAFLFPFSRILSNYEIFEYTSTDVKSAFVTTLHLTIFRVSCSYLSQLFALISAQILVITVSLVKISG